MRSSETTPATPGIFGALKRAIDTGLEIIQTRLELIGVEVREEKGRLIGALILASAVIFTSFMAFTMLTLTLVFLFWESAPLQALIGITIFYIVAAIGCVIGLKTRLKHPPLPFAGTISELKKDRAWVQTQK